MVLKDLQVSRGERLCFLLVFSQIISMLSLTFVVLALITAVLMEIPVDVCGALHSVDMTSHCHRFVITVLI